MLELYAAGALTEAERLEVEQMASHSPEIKGALQEACSVMDSYANLYAVAPKPALKDRIMAQIAEQEPLPFTTETEVEEKDNVHMLYPETESSDSAYKWMFAASVVLFLLSGFMSFKFYNNWQDAESRLAIAQATEQTMAQNINTASYIIDQQEQVLSILRDSNYKPVKLQGVAAHPDANVMVYWNAIEQQVYLDVLQLPAPPSGKQYQLWALHDGKPVDAGMITLESDKKALIQQMKAIGAAQAFAITLEPAGGSANPTLEEMYVMGEVKS
jgi:anti-sigma-K factor RskA